MKKFRFGMIGCGGISQQFADAVRFLEGVELTAVASREHSRAAVFAEKNGVPHAFGNYREMLESGLVDAVYIATVNSAHYDNMMLALDCGVPILCEKPMLLSLAEFDAVAAKATEKRIPVMEAIWTIFLPAYHKLRELLQENAIGEPRLAYLSFCVDFEKNDASRIYNPALGGGLAFDIGVYNLHAAFTLFGDAYDDAAICGRQGHTGVDVRSTIALTYPDGLLTNLVTADCAGPRDLHIYGTSGSIRADFFNCAQSILLRHPDGSEERYDLPFACNGFEYEIKEFVSLVREGRLESELAPLSRSRKVCELMEKAYRTICLEKR